jgi:SAM-dependent methyltransferase
MLSRHKRATGEPPPSNRRRPSPPSLTGEEDPVTEQAEAADRDRELTVRARYAAAATSVRQRGETGLIDASDAELFGARLYPEASGIPQAAVDASLGCGNPVSVADLRPGETVLDLGSGGGLDVLLSARRVGPTGRAIGLDATPEMLELARSNAVEAGADNVEFVLGGIEEIPLPDQSVDVVISNCVIALSHRKDAVFSEIARVLRPGGRMGISDLVAEQPPASLPSESAGDLTVPLDKRAYAESLLAAGLHEVTITLTHEVRPGVHAAIVRARKPRP